MPKMSHERFILVHFAEVQVGIKFSSCSRPEAIWPRGEVLTPLRNLGDGAPMETWFPLFEPT